MNGKDSLLAIVTKYDPASFDRNDFVTAFAETRQYCETLHTDVQACIFGANKAYLQVRKAVRDY